MRFVKRIAVAAVLGTTLLTFGFSDAKFTDIDNHWAKSNILSVVEKGLMNGTGGDSFKPDREFSSYEALVSIARMLGAESADLLALEAKYGVSMLDKYSVPSYARKYMAFCIEKEIISSYDLGAFKTDSLLKKKDICVFLGKAMGVNANNSENITLSFNDELFIPTLHKHYIKYLMDNKVISDKGDSKGNFNPGQVVTRAVFAKMIDVASDVYSEGVKDIDTEKITEAAADTQNKDSQDITYDSIVEGKIGQVVPEYSNIVIETIDANGAITKKTYKLTQNTVATLDGEATSVFLLKGQDSAKLYISGESVQKIEAESKNKTLYGVFESLETGNTIVITQDENKISKYMLLDTTKIIKDGNVVLPKDLKKGNKLKLSFEYEKVLEINAESVRSSVKGIIDTITYKRGMDPKLTIVTEDENTLEYFISSNISRDNVILDGVLSTAYDLRPGMNVSMDIESEEIIRLFTFKIEEKAEKITFSGEIIKVNTELNMITVKYTDSKDVEVEKKVFLTKSKIGDISFNQFTINELKTGQKVMVIGSEYSDGVSSESVIVQ